MSCNGACGYSTMYSVCMTLRIIDEMPLGCFPNQYTSELAPDI